MKNRMKAKIYSHRQRRYELIRYLCMYRNRFYFPGMLKFRISGLLLNLIANRKLRKAPPPISATHLRTDWRRLQCCMVTKYLQWFSSGFVNRYSLFIWCVKHVSNVLAWQCLMIHHQTYGLQGWTRLRSNWVSEPAACAVLDPRSGSCDTVNRIAIWRQPNLEIYSLSDHFGFVCDTVCNLFPFCMNVKKF